MWVNISVDTAYIISQPTILGTTMSQIYSDIPPATKPLFYALVVFLKRRCLHFEAEGGLEWSNDPESYACGSVATGRASLAGKVKGDDPD